MIDYECLCSTKGKNNMPPWCCHHLLKATATFNPYISLFLPALHCCRATFAYYFIWLENISFKLNTTAVQIQDSNGMVN